MAQDIGRFLRGEAVEAGPESTRYRLRKFISRHRLAVITAGLVFALTTGSATMLAFQAFRLRTAIGVADQQRIQAEQVTTLLSEIITGANPHAEGRSDTTAVDLLDRGERSVRSTLRDQPKVLAKLLHLMGMARSNLDDLDRASSLLLDSVELARSVQALDQVALSLSSLAELRLNQAQLDEALQVARDSVAAARAQPDLLVLAEVLPQLGNTLRENGQLEEAEATLLEATALATELETVPYRVTRRADYMLALVRLRLGKSDLALTALYDLLEAETANADQGAFINDVRNVIGAQLVDAGRSAEAAPYFEAALAGQREALGPGHSRTLVTLSNLALVVGNLGDLERARDLNLEGLEAMRSFTPGPHRTIALMLNNLGLNYHGLGQLEAAEATFREALRVQREVVGTDHPNLAFHLSNLGRVLQETGRAGLAEQHLRDALSLRQKHLPSDHPNVADSEVWLGALLLETGRASQAREHLQRGVEIREAKLAPNNWRTAEANSWLGSALMRLGEKDRGLELLETAYPLIRDQRGDHWHRTPAALKRLIAGYRSVGDESAAEAHELRLQQRHAGRS